MPHSIPPDLLDLAKAVSDWLDAAPPGIPAVYLFGSRVRGDHRPDSDVDLRIRLNEWDPDPEFNLNWWWTDQNEANFADLKARLPGKLSLHRENDDGADAAIRAGAADPVLTVGRVICVWTPPKPSPQPVRPEE